MADRHQLLVVDHQPRDVELLREAVHELKANVDLHHVPDAATAVAFLQKHSRFEHAPQPDLILLELDLPKLNGIETLRLVKATPAWADTPVVVLTATEDPHLFEKARQLGATSVWTKPSNWKAYSALVEHLVDCLRKPVPLDECLEQR